GHLGALADHLAVDLALRGDVHDDVTEDGRGTPQATALDERPPAPVTRLELTRRAQRRGVGRDRRDGALAHLAAAADSAAAAHRGLWCPGRPRPAGRKGGTRPRRCRASRRAAAAAAATPPLAVG